MIRDADSPASLLAEVLPIVEHAGELALRHFRRPLEVHDKSDGGPIDPVTRADIEVERFLRRELACRFPDYGLVGEELGAAANGAKRCWVVDPIDGTQAFISGFPVWGILVGLTERGAPIGGLLHQPLLKETFLGTGSASWLLAGERRQRLSTRAVAEPADAVLYSTNIPRPPRVERLLAFERVADACRMVRFGGDCYAYALLAMGLVDLVIDDRLAPWDILPLVPIVEGAGGRVSYSPDPPDGGLVIAAASPTLLRRALALWNAAKPRRSR